MNSEILKGLLVLLISVGVPLVFTLIIHHSMKKESSFYSPIAAEVLSTFSEHLTVRRFMSSTMKNGCNNNLDKVNSPSEICKLNGIPLFFEKENLFMKHME